MSHKNIPRRAFLGATAGVLSGKSSIAQAQAFNAAQAAPRARPLLRIPNIVYIICDDLGYGDVGVYGSRIPTPNIDAMAEEGVRFTQFYSASPVCSPARAALLTGRYPPRLGITRVMFPDDSFGIPDSETTIAQMLKSRGYKTMAVGKWHLGAQPRFLPTNRGFDEYFGLPFSNDMWPRPLVHNTQVIESPATLETLTPRYTDQAVNFISRSKDAPFFLYMAHTYPHIPIAASDRFRGKSGLGLYGDAVAEIDWSVGQVLQAIKDNGLDAVTLVMFSSDHGPWYQGSPGRLRGRKGETYEGGVRLPFIARFPGQIPAGSVSHSVASTLDILPTLARLSSAPLPAKPVDGIDIWPLLSGQKDAIDRDVLLYFDSWQLQCARMGRWKLHMSRYNSFAWTPDPPGGRMNLPLKNPELYDLEADPQESYDIAPQNPQIVAAIQARIQQLIPTFPGDVASAWINTMNAQVIDTPEGALPAPKTP